MYFKKYLHLLLLLAIFIIALTLRFYKLDTVPLGFHVDEANLGYNAYSILKTGKDDSGNFLPLYVNMFNDFNPTGYQYLSTVPVLIFGLTVFATRFAAALFGALLILPIYYIGCLLFNRRVGLVAALFCAIAPWSVIFSRSSAETVVATFFAVCGIAYLLESAKSQKIVSVILAGVFFILSVSVYPAPRVFIPIIFFIFFFFPIPIWKQVSALYKKALVACFVIVCAVIMYLIFSVGGGTARFNQVSIFTFPQTKLIEEEQIREDGIMSAGILSSRMFHNKAVGYTWRYVDNYFQYFTGEFLFTQGGRPIWFSIPEIGVILISEAPFLLYGIYLVAKNKSPLPKFIFVWLLVAPAIAALTVDDTPNMRRSLLMFPAIELLAAYGLVEVVAIAKKFRTALVIVITGIFVFNILFFLHEYFIHQPIHQNWYRNVGFAEMMDRVKSNYNNYDKIVMTKDTGGIYPLVLFYMHYDPTLYQAEGSTKDKEYTGFGKFFFVPQACPAVNGDNRFPKGKVLYIENGTCKPLLLAKQEYIRRLDGSPAYHIVYKR